MLTKIRLENFRCFRDHTVPFRNRTIVVGKNNAGKSTIVEGLRLIWLALDKYRAIHYVAPPRWLQLHKSVRGIIPSLDNQAFNFEKVFHQYNDPPAQVTASFSNGATVCVYVGPDNTVFATFRDKRGYVAKSRSEVERIGFSSLGILHQVAPVRSIERIIDENRVRQCLNSSLTPIHFRNQLKLLKDEYFTEFKDISESTWHGLQIKELRDVSGPGGERQLQLMVRNEDFVADLSWMGHGLQMWLQAMWFIARTREHTTVILDEPDVYMHADLQRRLIRLLRHRYPQVIIATHSIEIMDEVDPDDILIVDRGKREAKFATDRPEVQQVINFIGGMHNLQLSRSDRNFFCKKRYQT
jgi:AAA ATPase domain/AAA domain, putative AbiEii toxin, Type IV TA system